MSRLLAALFDLWHVVVSPALPRACRFHPTCSTYAAESLRRFGIVSGGSLALRRLARCHPWNPGGFDPVPRAGPLGAVERGAR